MCTHHPPELDLNIGFKINRKIQRKFLILTAILEWISSKSLGAVADGIAIVQFAQGVKAAGIWFTGILGRTAAHLGIAIVAWRALAHSAVVDHVAEGEGAALAGGGALAVDTGLAGVTLRVRATALTGQTLDIGVAQESGQAATVGAVVDGNALGILAARILLAGIDAAAVEAIAELRRWTVLVVLADMGACYVFTCKGYGAIRWIGGCIYRVRLVLFRSCVFGVGTYGIIQVSWYVYGNLYSV